MPGSMRPRRGTLVPGTSDLAVGLRVGFDSRFHTSLFYDQKSAKSEEPDTSVMPAPQGTVCARIQIRGRSFAGRIESGTVSLVRDTIVVGLTAGFRKSAPGHAILSGRDYIHIFII